MRYVLAEQLTYLYVRLPEPPVLMPMFAMSLPALPANVSGSTVTGSLPNRLQPTSPYRAQATASAPKMPGKKASITA